MATIKKRKAVLRKDTIGELVETLEGAIYDMENMRRNAAEMKVDTVFTAGWRRGAITLDFMPAVDPCGEPTQFVTLARDRQAKKGPARGHSRAGQQR